jgi:hypothetical protein
MDSFARNFVISALFYLGIMTLFGLAMALNLPWSYYFRYTHIHLGLLGWMSMMIFGVGYHVIPRFSARPIYSKKLGSLHWFLANLGLIGMAVFFPLRSVNPSFTVPFTVSAVIQTVSIFLFIFNIGATLSSRRAVAPAVPLNPKLETGLERLKNLKSVGISAWCGHQT